MQINDMCLRAVPVEKWDHAQKCMVETGEYMFDSQGANKSAELIGKHLGLFKEKVEINGDLSIRVTLPQTNVE
jgi:phage terminase small subunit